MISRVPLLSCAVVLLTFAWVPSSGAAEPKAKAPGASPAPPADRMVQVGPLTVRVPDFFRDVNVTTKGPLHRLTATADRDVTFLLAVVSGRGNRAELAKYLSEAKSGYGGVPREVALTLPRSGLHVQGLRIEKVKGLESMPQAVIETYAAPLGGDLLLFDISVAEPSPHNEKLRELLVVMADAAAARRRSTSAPH